MTSDHQSVAKFTILAIWVPHSPQLAQAFLFSVTGFKLELFTSDNLLCWTLLFGCLIAYKITVSSCQNTTVQTFYCEILHLRER